MASRKYCSRISSTQSRYDAAEVRTSGHILDFSGVTIGKVVIGGLNDLIGLIINLIIMALIRKSTGKIFPVVNYCSSQRSSQKYYLIEEKQILTTRWPYTSQWNSLIKVTDTIWATSWLNKSQYFSHLVHIFDNTMESQMSMKILIFSNSVAMIFILNLYKQVFTINKNMIDWAHLTEVVVLVEKSQLLPR